MSNKKIYKNRLSLPIFDNKGIGNGNGVAYIPNVIRGGSAIPIGNNMFLMRGRSHAQGGIDIGRDLEVEGNEVVQNGKFGTKVFSSVPFLRGVSPAERVLRGENPDTVFAAQETWKRVNKIADDGSKRAALGISFFKPSSPSLNFAGYLHNGGLSKLARRFRNIMIGASVADSPTATGIARWNNVDGDWQQPNVENNINLNTRKELNLEKPINTNVQETTNAEDWYPSDDTLNFIKNSEKFVDHVYDDGKGIPTIGYGLTASTPIGRKALREYANKKMPKKVADEFFNQTVKSFIDPFKNATPNFDKLTNNQRNALFSYYYNVGHGSFTTKSPNLQKALRELNHENVLKNIDFDYNNPKFKGARIRRDRERNMYKGLGFVDNVVNKQKRKFGGMKLNIFKLGGLSRSKDYGSKDKPYPSVDKNDFAGGGRSYPIPTRADAVDALRLAGLHHRSDVRAKVYAKYPDLRKKAAMGTIDDEDVLEALRAGNVRNATEEERIAKPVRTNYVERNNSNDLAEIVGKGVVGSLIGGSTIFGLNKLAKNYTPSLSKNNRFVSPIYDVVENPTDLERKYNYPKRVANRIKNSGVEELWDKRRLEDATKRVNSVLDKYGDKIKIVNEPVAKEISSTQVYDVAKPKKYTPNLSEFSPKVKAGVQQINRQNLNLARRLGTNIRNIGGILGKTLPGVALVDFVRNLFPSKQQEQEADKAWRRHKSPTGRIPEDYQLKFGGRRKALFGEDDEDVLSSTLWKRLSLTNPKRYLVSGKNGKLSFDRNYNTPIYDMFRNPATRALVPSNEFSPGKFYEDLGETIPVESITLSDIARSAEPTLPNPSRSWVYNVPDYTGNINGQEVVINPDYIQQVPRSVRQAILNNTPEIVRGTSSTRRGANSTISVNRARQIFNKFYHNENQPIFEPNPLVSRFYNYGWSHNSFDLSDKSKAAIENAKRVNEELNNFKNIDLSKYFNADGTPKPNPTRRTQPISVRTERVGNIPGVYTENMKRPNLTQLGTQGIGLNMPAYENPFATRTSNYDIGLPMTLDTSKLDSMLSKYGVTPISSSTGVQPNPADVEAVRSGNFKAIDNDRYVPIHTTTEDWVGLGANLLGSIGSYLGTRAMLNRYPMPNKPVPAIAQKLKTRININPQLDTIREQVGRLNTSIDNNTSSSRVAQARKQGVSNNAVASRNQLYGQKENAETQLINQDIMNRQRIGLYNNQIYNDYLNRLGSARQYLANARISNFNNVLSGANQSIQDLLGRIENRDADRRNFIFMEAAYPNVNWRNIFQGDPELARSLGFRFVK